MPRVWKGAVSFGLVAIPVAAHTATEDRDVRFHQVHRADGGRVRNKKTCEIDGEEVQAEDIAKGFDVGGGERVLLEDSDLEDLPIPTAHMIDVVQFVPASQIDPIMYNTPYYLTPEGPAALKAYSLMRDALAAQDRVGLVKVAFRSKEQIAALRVYDRVLVLHTLLWPDEVRDPGQLKVKPGADDKPHAHELQMATQLIESRTEDWDPLDVRFHDDYRKAVQAVIDAKVSGREVIEAPLPASEANAGQALDLMAALRASVEEARQAHAAPDPPAKPTKKASGRALKAVPPAAPAKAATAAKKAAAKKAAKPRKTA